MITKINSKVADKYTVLFEKATALLKDKAANAIRDRIDDANSKLPETETPFDFDTFGIGSLNEYFAMLEDLVNIDDLTEEEKAFYLRLPLDEDVFAINADTRVITVPANFARNGVGVQGDESAEVLYFTIDRYFDSMDLARPDVDIRIQWEAKDANKQVIRGISKNFGKDIDSEAGKGLMIFGWPISSKLTQTNGTIKFAVRFFIRKTDNTLSYSFSTLPAEITINASLDYNMLERMENELEDGQDIINRIKSNGVYDSSGPIPTKPIITTGLYVYDPITDSANRIIDLPEEDQPIKLAVSAKPADIGIIEYIWKKYTYDENTGDYATSPITITEGITQEKVQKEDTIDDNDIERYYTWTIVNGNDKYTLIDIKDLEDKEPNEDGEFLYKGNTVKLYKLYSVLTISNNNQAAGIYTVDIKARTIVNSSSTEMNSSDGIEIPGPKQPEFNANNQYHIIADEGTAELQVSANKNSEEKNYENAVVDITYDWKEKHGDLTVDLENSAYEYEYTLNSDKTILGITGLETEDLDIKYFAKATATRNKISTTVDSEEYRITNSPKAPKLYERVYENGVWVNKLIQPIVDGLTTQTRTVNGDYTIKFSVDSNIQSDRLTYIWMKMNLDDESDIVNDVVQIRADLDNLVDGLDAEGEADYALGEDDEEIISAANIEKFRKVLDKANLTELGQLADDNVNGPQYIVKAGNPGYYYCVVINELNAHYAVSITPFYNIIPRQ